MDGLCDWLDACIMNLGVNPTLLEGKVQRLLDAINILYVFFFDRNRFESNISNTQGHHLSLSLPLNIHKNQSQIHGLFLVHHL